MSSKGSYDFVMPVSKLQSLIIEHVEPVPISKSVSGIAFYFFEKIKPSHEHHNFALLM